MIGYIFNFAGPQIRMTSVHYSILFHFNYLMHFILVLLGLQIMIVSCVWVCILVLFKTDGPFLLLHWLRSTSLLDTRPLQILTLAAFALDHLTTCNVFPVFGPSL